MRVQAILNALINLGIISSIRIGGAVWVRLDDSERSIEEKTAQNEANSNFRYADCSLENDRQQLKVQTRQVDYTDPAYLPSI